MAEDGCSTTQDQIPRAGSSWLDVHLCSGGLQPGSHAKSDGAACLRAGGRSAGRGSADSAEPHGPHSSDALTLNRPRTPRRNLRSLAFQQPASVTQLLFAELLKPAPFPRSAGAAESSELVRQVL